MKKKFKITYIDPETGVEAVVVKEFEDTIVKNSNPKIVNSEIKVDITAEEWAEDLAYSLADKGYHKVEEII